MSLDEHWFSEAYEDEGVAFSLRVRRTLLDEHTPYQHLQVFETSHWGNLMTLDGCVMLTSRDNFLYHEMMSHPALFTHPEPRRVLIIGGGDCGTLREVLRHPAVEQAVQVDIDEAVTRAAERFFPELTEANDDRRAELRFADGVAYVRDAAGGAFDVVIIDSTDPVGFAEGLFGAAFLTDVHRILADGGVLVQQSESPLLHGEGIIRNLHTALAEAGFAQRATLPFPVPSYPGGWWSATLAGKGVPVDCFREADAAAMPFPTQYYSPGVHRGALAPPPLLARAMAVGSGTFP
ncbi:polyamine aminopropyltransferase [Arhodomonas sp. SL1]|uniref:polyamine aminopropyltransferase n=1 Tax=Arhodomonas sp. SL1 TaxID=3425691 RepID=UPI003F881955